MIKDQKKPLLETASKKSGSLRYAGILLVACCLIAVGLWSFEDVSEGELETSVGHMPTRDICAVDGTFPDEAFIELADLQNGPNGIQYQTWDITIVPDNQRPFNHIPETAIIHKNVITANGHAMVATSGNNKVFPRVMFPVSLMEHRNPASESGDVNGWSGAFAKDFEAGKNDNSKDSEWRRAALPNKFSAITQGYRDAMKKYKINTQDPSILAAFTSSTKPSGVKVTRTDLWMGNGWTKPMYLTDAERCEFLVPVRGAEKAGQQLYVFNPARAGEVKFTIPYIPWTDAALNKLEETQRSKMDMARIGLEYELDAEGFRPIQVANAPGFGRWKGKDGRDDGGRDPRNFPLTVELHMHAAEPLFTDKSEPSLFRIATDEFGAGIRKWELVTEPFTAAQMSKLGVVIGKKFRHAIYGNWEDVVDVNPSLSPGMQSFLGWVLKSPQLPSKFPARGFPQLTEGVVYKRLVDLSDKIQSDFDSKMNPSSRYTGVYGSANKNAGEMLLRKNCLEQVVSHCEANTEYMDCENVLAKYGNGMPWPQPTQALPGDIARDVARTARSRSTIELEEEEQNPVIVNNAPYGQGEDHSE